MGIAITSRKRDNLVEYIIKGQPSDKLQNTHSKLLVFCSNLQLRYAKNKTASTESHSVGQKVYKDLIREPFQTHGSETYNIDDAQMTIEFFGYNPAGKTTYLSQISISIEPSNTNLEKEIERIFNEVKDFNIKAK